MSEKRVDIIFALKDEVSGPAQKLMADVKRIASSGQAYDVAPLRKVNRSMMEQDVRNEMAARVKAMRAEQRRWAAQEEADFRMFGPVQLQAIKEESVKVGAVAAEKTQEGFFKRLKSQAGRGSTLHETLELVRGGGAAIGISLIGKSLEGITQRLVEMKNGADGVALSWQEMSLAMAQSIPLLDGFSRAGQNIQQLIPDDKLKAIRDWVDPFNLIHKKDDATTGDLQRQAMENRLAEANNRKGEIFGASVKQYAQQDEAARLAAFRAAYLAGAEGSEAERAKAQFAFEDENRQIAERYAQREKIITDNALTLAAKEKELAKMREAQAVDEIEARRKYDEALRKVERDAAAARREAQGKEWDEQAAAAEESAKYWEDSLKQQSDAKLQAIDALKNYEVAQLKRRAADGDPNATMQLKRFGVNEEFDAQRKALQEVVDNISADPAQRQMAAAAIQANEADRAKALAALNKPELQGAALSRIASTFESKSMLGLGAAAREGQDVQKKQLKTQEELLKSFQIVANWITGQQPAGVI